MSDYVGNLASKGLSLAVGFLTSVMLARYLGVAPRGELAFITQLSGILAIVLGLGLNQSFPYYFKAEPTRSTYAIFVRYFLLQVFAYSLIGTSLSIITQDKIVTLIVLMTVATVGYQQMESAMATFDVGLKIRVNMTFSVLRLFSIGLVVALLPSSLLWPALVQSGLWLSVVGTYLVATGVGTGRVAGRAHLTGVLRYSCMPMFSAALVVMNYNVDTLMIKALGTPDDLGLYSVAAGLVTYMWVAPDAIKEVVQSRVARCDDVRELLPALRGAVLLSLLSTLAFCSLGWWFVPFVFGSEFGGSFPLGAILSLGVVSMTFYKIVGVVFLAEGRTGYYFGVLAIAVLTNFVLNSMAIPVFGATGAAWSSVVSYSVTGGMFILQFCRWKELGLREVLFPTRREIDSVREFLERLPFPKWRRY